MEGFDRKAIKKLAARQTADPGAHKEIFFHSLVLLGVSLAIVLLDYMLQEQIGFTGGLSGMGTRSVLETIRTVLQYANMLLTPFWQMSMVYWAICRARGQETGFASFLEGFRRFGPILRLQLLEGIALWMILIVVCIIGSVIFSFSPLALPIMKILLPYMQAGTDLNVLMMDEAVINQILPLMYPAYIIIAVLLIPALLPLYCRFRMASYALMDEKGTGAIMALIRSFQITKKQSWRLIKLDLSFWWYLALELVAELLLYAQLLLPLLGLAVPEGASLLLLSYGGSYGILLVVYTLFRGRLETTYALAYNALNAGVPKWKPPVIVKNDVPWDAQ